MANTNENSQELMNGPGPTHDDGFNRSDSRRSSGSSGHVTSVSPPISNVRRNSQFSSSSSNGSRRSSPNMAKSSSCSTEAQPICDKCNLWGHFEADCPQACSPKQVSSPNQKPWGEQSPSDWGKGSPNKNTHIQYVEEVPYNVDEPAEEVNQWTDTECETTTSQYQNNSDQGSARSCYKCNEQGHMARECPNADSRPPITCYKCNEEGHMSRECPNADSRPMTCHKCQEEGHMARECPNSDSRPMTCHKCNEEGHMARECPNSDSRPMTCHKCQEEGHMARECPNPQNDTRKCYKCQQNGHISRDCPEENGESTGWSNNDSGRERSGQDRGPQKCYNCQEEGHISRECTNEAVPRGNSGDPSDESKPPARTYIPTEVEDDDLFECGIEAGINFNAVKDVSAKVSGEDSNIQPVETFADAYLEELLLNNIRRAKYTKPTPIQKYGIPIILERRDLMACAQTGSGKTAAFLIPVINQILQYDGPIDGPVSVASPTTLIISPTRELAIQIYNEARKFAVGTFVKCAVTYGGTSVMHQWQSLKHGCHILVATPGRLLDNLERCRVTLASTEHVILDEADRMLDMGFKETIDKIIGHSSAKEERQTMMFSATFPKDIQEMAYNYMKNYLFLVVGMVGAANTDVKQIVQDISGADKRSTLLSFIEDQVNDNAKSKVLVFVESRRTADFVTSMLSGVGLLATSIHGDRAQDQREAALADFKRGSVNVLVATNVASRGLDIRAVSQVVNYDMPRDIDEYVHRIGRTGRVGNHGVSVSFFDVEKDVGIAKDLIKILSDASQEVPSFLTDCARSGGSVATFTNNQNSYRSTDFRSRRGGSSQTSYNHSGDRTEPAFQSQPEEEESWN